jgi:nitrite reductase (cytochrome c-552)
MRRGGGSRSIGTHRRGGGAIASQSIAALLINIFQRKTEGRNPFYRVVEINENTDDPKIWGKNFPAEYDGYKRTVDMTRTRYGGSEAEPRTPTNADPRSIVARSRLEQDPRLKTMWAGYAFAVDFREDRGHAYMLDDHAERQLICQPGTCLHCHASIVVPYRKLGDGDLTRGFERMNACLRRRAKARDPSIACIDATIRRRWSCA